MSIEYRPFSIEEVERIAHAFVDSQINCAQWEYRLSVPERDVRYPSEWNVFVEWIPVGGGTWDGEQTIVIVDEIQKSARLFDRQLKR